MGLFVILLNVIEIYGVLLIIKPIRCTNFSDLFLEKKKNPICFVKRNCPKYVEFYSKGKFGKLVHLVGFII